MGYVQRYKFTQESIDPASTTYRVSLEITFFADRIAKALENGGVKIAEKPKVVVIIDERPMEMVTEASFLLTASPIEEMFRESVLRAGRMGIGRAKVRTLKNDAEVMKAVNGDAAAVKWLAGQYAAELVVVGAARAKPSANGQEMEGLVWTKIYDGASASPIWAQEVKESVAGTVGADRFRAIRQCADKMNVLLGEFLAAPRPPRKADN
jgi:hypothetical protein